MKAYISFEGVFGCGKTTNITMVSEELQKRGEKILVVEGGTSGRRLAVKEPSIYSQYRKLMGDFYITKKKITDCVHTDLRRLYFTLDLPIVESFLALARHAIDWEVIVFPALKDKKLILLLDRGVDTFYVHQIIKFLRARINQDKKVILEQMRRIVLTWMREPDLTIYIRVPVDEAIKRLRIKGEKPISHSLDIEILKESIKVYDFLASYFKDRFVTFDGCEPLEKNTKLIVDAIYSHLEGLK